MNKYLLYFIAVCVLASGCSRDNYSAEKEFYKASKILRAADQLFAGGERTDPVLLEPAITAFRKVAEKYPSSPKAPESLFIISQIRVQQHNLSGAREVLLPVIQNYDGVENWAQDARYRIAQLYEEEGNWTEAEKAYWEVAEYHTLKPKGLYAPIYVLSHYKNENDVAGEAEAYKKAVSHFEEVLEQTGPIELSASIKYFYGIVQATHGHWQDARTVWLKSAEEYPKDYYAPLAVLAAAEVSAKNGEKEQALSIYEDFRNRYSMHELAGRTVVLQSTLYHELGNFTKERELLTESLAKYFSKNANVQADIRLLIGKSFQDEGNWNEAQRVYQEIETRHPGTGAALQIPLMTALYQNTSGQTDAAEKSLNDAIARYQQVQLDHPDSASSVQARRLMTAAYAQKGDWNQVMTNVEEDMQKETETTRKGSWLFLKALIAENRIKDAEQAASLYKAFLSEYPEHPLVKIAKTHLESLSGVSAS